MYYLGKGKGILKTNSGLKLYVNTQEKSITPHLVTDKFWEPNITAFMMRTIRPNWKIIEIGANIGYYSTMMAAKVGPNGHITCLEPNPYAFDLLKDNMDVNGFFNRAALYQCAASDKDAIATFNILKDHQVSSSLMEHKDLIEVENRKYWSEPQEEITVPTMTLDYLAQDKQIDFMKIDAEGYEYRIISAANKMINANPNMQMVIEFVPEYLQKVDDNGPEALLMILRHYGYKLAYIDEKGTPIATDIPTLLSRHYSELFLTK